jgi:hypothetical protein
MQTNTTNTYTVWVGGIADIENAPLDKAQLIYQQWIDQGYDDVVIELETN